MIFIYFLLFTFYKKWVILLEFDIIVSITINTCFRWTISYFNTILVKFEKLKRELRVKSWTFGDEDRKFCGICHLITRLLAWSLTLVSVTTRANTYLIIETSETKWVLRSNFSNMSIFQWIRPCRKIFN